MRKTLTLTLLLAASLMCSITILAQRPYIPDGPIQNPIQNQSQNQIGDSVLRQLRALLGDEVAYGVEPVPQSNSSNSHNSSSKSYNTSSTSSSPSQTPGNAYNSYYSSSTSASASSYPGNPAVQVVEVNTNDLPLQKPYIEDLPLQKPYIEDVPLNTPYIEDLPLQKPYIEEVNTQETNSSKSIYSSDNSYNSNNSNGFSGPTPPTSYTPTTATPSATTTSSYNSNSSYSNTSSYNTSFYNNNQPNVVVYPKIKATVGSEIIVEPAQAIRTTPNQQWPTQQPYGQNTVQQPISSGTNLNGYVVANDNLNGYNGNNGYGSNGPSVKTPKVSELYTLVDGDTVSVILPQRNLGRFDRGLYNYLYIPKGRWAFGLTASYGEFNTEDVELLNILKDFDVKGKLYSIKPFITYFFRNNQSMGMRLNYTRGEADLGSMVFDFDDDMSFDLKDISYYYEGYSMSVFYRNYVGLDRNSRFSVFNDIDLSFSSGSSRFKRYYDQVTRDTQTTSMGVALNFSPGVCVFIMDNAAFNVSFGVFGVSMHREKQMTDGVEEGSRFSSGANFKFNLFNINFGLMIVI